MDRYESEVEEERVSSLGKEESRDQVFVRLSDDFLEEINVNGKVKQQPGLIFTFRTSMLRNPTNVTGSEKNVFHI